MKKTPDFVTWIWGFFVFESPFLLSILGFLVQFWCSSDGTCGNNGNYELNHPCRVYTMDIIDPPRKEIHPFI